jgi:glycosyltransferase involved in cell wall biosynthesis
MNRASDPRPVRVLFSEAARGRGGSSVCLARILPNLARLNVLPTALVYQLGPRFQRLRDSGIAVDDLDLKGIVPPDPFLYLGPFPRPTASFLRIMTASLKIIRRRDPEIVYFNGPLYPHLPVFAAARLLGKKTICHYRTTRPISKAVGLAARRLDAFIALTNAAAGFYASQGVPRDRIHRVYDGLDLEALDRAAAAGPVPEVGGGFKVVIVGALDELKGHEILLQAAGILRDELPDLRLLCAGTGPLREHLEQRAAGLGLYGRVVFLGYSDNVPALYSACDLCVCPSFIEGGLSQVALEAMAMRLPVIASDLIGVREIASPGETGLLVPPRDPEALARAILSVARDRAWGRQMGLRARAMLDTGRFSPQAEAEAIRAVLDHVLGERRA